MVRICEYTEYMPLLRISTKFESSLFGLVILISLSGCTESIESNSDMVTASPTIDCTPGYSPCLPPMSDYDCKGGQGNGPGYTGPVKVSGVDVYKLDRDRDGFACK